MVQNRFHYAITGKTAAEIIYATADRQKEHMGLTTWKNAPDGRILKSDVVVAKNYLSEQQIRQLERAVTGYFDYIEDLIERENTFTMKEFSESVNGFSPSAAMTSCRTRVKYLDKKPLRKPKQNMRPSTKRSALLPTLTKACVGCWRNPIRMQMEVLTINSEALFQEHWRRFFLLPQVDDSAVRSVSGALYWNDQILWSLGAIPWGSWRLPFQKSVLRLLHEALPADAPRLYAAINTALATAQGDCLSPPTETDKQSLVQRVEQFCEGLRPYGYLDLSGSLYLSGDMPPTLDNLGEGVLLLFETEDAAE